MVDCREEPAALSIRTREDTRLRVRGEAHAGELESALRRALDG